MGAADANWLFLSLIPSGVGFVLFTYGRKKARTPYVVAGLIYMVYPMVATSVTTLIVGGLLVAAGLWCAIRMDW